MVTEINVYVEGGGNNNQTRSELRRGFSAFLRELVDIARQNRIRWHIIPCGGRDAAYDDFCTAITTNPNAHNVLLVDSEIAVAAPKGTKPNLVLWTHLELRDPTWMRPAHLDDSYCFLMEQSMETWLIADLDNLARFYGHGFKKDALPRPANLEHIDKNVLMKELEAATAKTKTKGKYHKTRHAFDILATADPTIVRMKLSRCKHLFDVLAIQMGAEPFE